MTHRDFDQALAWADSLSPVELRRNFPSLDDGEIFGMMMMVQQLAEDGFAIAPEFASDPEIQEIARAMRRRIKEIRAERRAERSAEYNGDWELF